VPGESIHLTVHCPDDISGNIRCVELAPGRYRLQQSMILLRHPLYYDDVVELQPRPDGEFTFLRCTARSERNRSCYLLSKNQARSPKLEIFLEHVSAAGGNWEVWLNGVVILHLSRDSGFDPRQEFQRVFKSDPAEA